MVVDGEAVRKREVLVGQRANLEVRKNFFNIRAAKAWNEIPEEVKNQRSVNAFKNAYDEWKTHGSETHNLVGAGTTT